MLSRHCGGTCHGLKRIDSQLVRGHSATVVSAWWATVDWFCLKSEICVRGEWIVQPSPKIFPWPLRGKLHHPHVYVLYSTIRICPCVCVFFHILENGIYWKFSLVLLMFKAFSHYVSVVFILTFMWWECCGLCYWHKPTELCHSFLFSSWV